MHHIIDLKETEKLNTISDHIFKLKADYHKRKLQPANLMCEVQFTQKADMFVEEHTLRR